MSSDLLIQEIKRKCMICGYGRYCNNCQAHSDNHAAMFPLKPSEEDGLTYRCDMNEGELTIIRESDGDFILSIASKGISNLTRMASIQVCTIHGGGGKHPKLYEALAEIWADHFCYEKVIPSGITGNDELFKAIAKRILKASFKPEDRDVEAQISVIHSEQALGLIRDSLNEAQSVREISGDIARLPHEVKIGAVRFGKGIPLQTLIDAAQRWYKAASASFCEGIDIEAARAALTPPPPSDEDVHAITHCHECGKQLANEEITEIVNVCGACEKTHIEGGKS